MNCSIIQSLSFCHYFNMIVFLIYSLIIAPTIGGNVSLTLRPLSEHPLHGAWLWCCLLSVVGVILNGLALFIFIKERSSLVSSVNMMIMSVQNENQHNIMYKFWLPFRLDTVHRLVRSVLINWRVLCLMKDENPLSRFGIERDMVNAIKNKMQYFMLREC